MRKLLFGLTLISLMLSTSVSASTDYQCMGEYQKKIKEFYPNVELDEDQQGWVYKLKGYHWLTKVAGKPAAGFIVAFVPGAIPVVLTASAVTSFFDVLKNEKGIVGAYIVLNLSQIDEQEFINNDIDSVVEEDILKLQENKYKREHNLFHTFVKRVNKKYKNTNFSYEEVRQAVIEIASEDRALCERGKKKKNKLASLNRLIRVTKKKLIKQAI
jgi:hypothetical protein